jgi:hypothetical protein
VLGFDVPFTSLSKLCKNAGLKPFCWAKPACCNFTSFDFNLQGHILSTYWWSCSYINAFKIACLLSFFLKYFYFFCGGAQIVLCPFTCFFSIGDGWVALQDFVSHMEAATLQSLYLQHNYLTDFGSLSSSVLPSNVAFCVQYNCMLPPPQSLCPEQIAGIEAISRPANECATVLRSNSP